MTIKNIDLIFKKFSLSDIEGDLFPSKDKKKFARRRLINESRITHLTLHDRRLAWFRLDLGDTEIVQRGDAGRGIDVLSSSSVFDFTIRVIGRHDGL